MTEKTQPTDAELMPCPFCGEAAKHSFNDFYGDMSMACCKSCGATAYAPKWNRRAVLAKWGSPVVAGDVDRADAVNLARNALTQYDCAITKKGVRVLAEAVLSMDSALTTPQPTHAQAGAVTDAQVLAAVRVVSPNLFRHGLQPLPHDGANTAAQMRKEADTARKILEAANGIKGGQHGAT